jgi:predicted DNA-binding ribbon-helix-helix protein
MITQQSPQLHRVRTSVVLPEELWLRAKDLAARQHRDLRALIIEGLQLVLADEGSLRQIRAQAERTRRDNAIGRTHPLEPRTGR